LETRQDRIAQDLDKAHELKAEADGAIAAYEQELAEAQQGSANEIGNKACEAAKAAAEAERQKVELNSPRSCPTPKRASPDPRQGHGRCRRHRRRDDGTVVKQLILAAPSPRPRSPRR
jgi:hypothetical protein